jgi:outer membrane biosynthesis protein TonB
VVPPFARISRVSGTVEVAFTVDAAGISSVHRVEGPELLERAAEDAVATWRFRRSTAERLFLVAELSYQGDDASATVRLRQE